MAILDESVEPAPRKVDQVVERIRQAIINGDLSPESRLHHDDLAVRLGVSRTPVREAVRILEAEGFLESRPNRRVYVVRMDLQRVMDAYQVREYMDGLAARLAALRMSPSEVDGLVRLLDSVDLTAEVEPEATLRANLEFHRTIALGSRNSAIQRLIPEIEVSNRLMHAHLLRQPARIRAAWDEHRAIVAAIRGRSARQAERLARHHIRSAVAFVTGLQSG